jgi:hypothetical protein
MIDGAYGDRDDSHIIALGGGTVGFKVCISNIVITEWLIPRPFQYFLISSVVLPVSVLLHRAGFSSGTGRSVGCNPTFCCYIGHGLNAIPYRYTRWVPGAQT